MAIERVGKRDGRGKLEPRAGLRRSGDRAKRASEAGATSGAGGAQPGLKKSGSKKSAATKSVAKKSEPKKSAAKKSAAKKSAAKKSAAKHAAKKTSANSAGERRSESVGVAMAQRLSPDAEMARAFHHLQRAVAVISLVERESGDDLRLLLKQGIELYRSASGSKDAVSVVRCAFGLLRAAEHLGMAGLYAARNEYRVAVPAPTRKEVERHLLALGPRLDALQGPEQEHGLRLKEMARELLRQAEGAVADPHLEYELTMAADGICTALEEGL